MESYGDKDDLDTQGRHGEFEPGKAQYSTPNFLTVFFL